MQVHWDGLGASQPRGWRVDRTRRHPHTLCLLVVSFFFSPAVGHHCDLMRLIVSTCSAPRSSRTSPISSSLHTHAIDIFNLSQDTLIDQLCMQDQRAKSCKCVIGER